MMQEESMQSYGHTSYTDTHSVFVVNGSLCQRVTYVLSIKASGYIALMEVLIGHLKKWIPKISAHLLE